MRASIARLRRGVVFAMTPAVATSIFACASRQPPPPRDAPEETGQGPPCAGFEPRFFDGGAPPPRAGGPDPGRPCGDLGCRLFDLPVKAFAAVLESSPRILGVGEAHAQAGTENIEPSTRRFTRDFLPLLKDRASDIVVELLVPNPKCRKETAKAKERQKVVTERQAATDQNDYVALGNRARELGIRPHALEPTCDDLARIAGAGEDAITVSLDVVTRLSRETIESLYRQNLAETDFRIVVAYGGAMHNDSNPRPGREQWSFGPALQTLTDGRYVDIDLIVPEFISDSPAWKSLPWVAAFDPHANPASTTLYALATNSFVLVFPMTSSTTTVQ